MGWRMILYLLFAVIFTYGLYTYPFEGDRGWRAVWRANPGLAVLMLGVYLSVILRTGELLGLWTVPGLVGGLCILMAVMGGL